MRIIRVVLVIALVALVPLSVSGLWADRALSDSDAYAERMKQAWKTGGLMSEFDGLLTDATLEQVYDYFGATERGQNALADFAADFAVGTVTRQVGSGAFVKAWYDWHYGLHQDLAAVIRGETPPGATEVDGSELTVDISPLVGALLTGRIGDLVEQAAGDQLSVQRFDTGYDLESDLESLGSMWSARWLVVAAAVAVYAALVLLFRPRLVNAAVGAAAGSIGCVAVAIWRSATSGVSPEVLAASPTPLLSQAVSDAITGSWTTWLLTSAVLLGLASVGMLVLARRRSSNVAVPEPDAQVPIASG